MNSTKGLNRNPVSHRTFKGFKVPKEYKNLGISIKYMSKVQNRRARHLDYITVFGFY